jgi:uncharacterized protein (UPF0216 family)
MFNEDEKISIKFLQTLNRHLPVKRITLKELLLEPRPGIKSMDGSTHSFDKEELERLESIVPEYEHDRLRLPIYLEMSSSMERGAIKISGRIECMVINTILQEGGKIEEKKSIIIYYPHLRKVRKELPTTTQFMFTM